MEFFEVSAKTADKVEIAFNTLARKMMVKRLVYFLITKYSWTNRLSYN